MGIIYNRFIDKIMSMEIALNKKKGFTLAEALITLVIIGVIAALTIPGILVNTEQQEYKTAFKKALSSLNSVIEMNIALDGYGPLETVGMTAVNVTPAEDSLYQMFRRRMNIISTSSNYTGGGSGNWAFFTADGLRFEFPSEPKTPGNVNGVASKAATIFTHFSENNGACGTYGENIAMNDRGEYVNTPCLVIVDVNGERRPNPQKVTTLGYKVPMPNPATTSPQGGLPRVKVLDVFPVMITNTNAQPWGVIAQRAMFQHD